MKTTTKAAKALAAGDSVVCKDGAVLVVAGVERVGDDMLVMWERDTLVGAASLTRIHATARVRVTSPPRPR